MKASLNTKGLQEKYGNMTNAEGLLLVKRNIDKNDEKKKKLGKDKFKSQNLK